MSVFKLVSHFEEMRGKSYRRSKSFSAKDTPKRIPRNISSHIFYKDQDDDFETPKRNRSHLDEIYEGVTADKVSTPKLLPGNIANHVFFSDGFDATQPMKSSACRSNDSHEVIHRNQSEEIFIEKPQRKTPDLFSYKNPGQIFSENRSESLNTIKTTTRGSKASVLKDVSNTQRSKENLDEKLADVSLQDVGGRFDSSLSLDEKLEVFYEQFAEESKALRRRICLLELEVKTLRLRCEELEDRLQKPNVSVSMVDYMNDAFCDSEKREANTTTNSSTISAKTGSSLDQAFIGDSELHLSTDISELGSSLLRTNQRGKIDTAKYIEMLLSKVSLKE
ncbi:unnamed protein product, partial [Mesorhabditis belari]|uniref:Uncharacterized protein n=1 Tax=Mesorhabditis belari TaxID=2138241 RepID=A0AAF3J4J2_9BILA